MTCVALVAFVITTARNSNNNQCITANTLHQHSRVTPAPAPTRVMTPRQILTLNLMPSLVIMLLHLRLRPRSMPTSTMNYDIGLKNTVIQSMWYTVISQSFDLDFDT